jgi:hypothetical protein
MPTFRLLRTTRLLMLFVSMSVLLVPLTSPIRHSAISSAAASSPVPHKSASSTKAREEAYEKIHCPYWYVDRNTKAVLEITNNSETSRSVIPSLLVRGAEPISLDTVTIPSRATRRVSLNKALKSHVRLENDANRVVRWGDGSRIGSVWGSATLRGEMLGGVSSKVLTENPSESLAVHGGFYEYGSKSVSSQWWLPTKNSVALFAVQNTSYGEVPLATLLYLDGRLVAGPQVTLPAGASRLFDLRELIPKSMVKKLPEVGMVRFVPLADSSSLLGRTILFDDQKGFSIPLAMRDLVAHTSATLQTAGAPFGRPDKRLRFSKGTRFTTQLLLTNTANKSIDVKVTLDGRNAAGGPASWDLPVLGVSPLQSRVVDLDEVRTNSDSPIVDGYVGLRLTHTGSVLDLLAEAMTVDQTLRYSLDNALYDNESVGTVYNAISFNLTGNKNTLLLIKNPSNSTLISGYRLNYEKQGLMRAYKSQPIELMPYELRVVDLKTVRDSKVPDDDGQVLPADVEFGNANIFSNRPIISGDPNYDSVAGISSSCIAVCVCPEQGCLCNICEMYPEMCVFPPLQCNDTCTPCRNERSQKFDSCFAELRNCELLASAAYILALNTSCLNQGFCREGESTYDEDRCNDCKALMLAAYILASLNCADKFNTCLDQRKDCTGLRNLDCSPCSN